jgi:hypothetical protein
MKKRKLFNLTLVAFTLAALSFKPSVYADCDLEHCGNENLAPTQATQPTDHHELVLGILIGIGITLVVLLCIMALTKIRKKTTSR